MNQFAPQLPRIAYIGKPENDSSILCWLREVSRPRLMLPEMATQHPDLLNGIRLVLVDAEDNEAPALCWQLTRSSPGMQRSIIAVARMPDPQRATLLIEHGATDYMAAPLWRDTFLARMRTHLSYQTLLRAAHARKKRLKLRDTGSPGGTLADRAGMMDVFPIADEQDSLTAEETVAIDLDRRIASLHSQTALFLVALITGTQLLPPALSGYITSQLIMRGAVCVGPVHQAFTRLVSAYLDQPSGDPEHLGECFAMISACDGGAAAKQALRFVMDLSTLGRQPQAAASHVL